MRKSIRRTGLAVAILAPAIALTLWWHKPSTAESDTYASSQGQSIRGVTVSGTIRCKQRSAVAAEIVAPVKALPVEEGRRVSKGDVLVELDGSVVAAQCAMARARLELAAQQLAEYRSGPRKQEITKAAESVIRARAVLTYAQREHTRLVEARNRIVATPLEVSRAASQVAKAESDLAWAKANLDLLHAGTRPEQIARGQAKLALAQADLKRCEAMYRKYLLRAPHDGIVTVRYVNVGEVVSPGQVLLRVDNMQALEVRAQVQESQLIGVKKGSAALVLVDAYPDSALKAVVRQILPRVDPEQGTVTVLLGFTAKPGVTLMDGMAADIAIFTVEKK